ncbi:hypothetical protein HDV00_005669 [Rhizophlyctis rosea]|nr:hypothetical protein HDV00_005669 [Rhizophlyctis rosea]
MDVKNTHRKQHPDLTAGTIRELSAGDALGIDRAVRELMGLISSDDDDSDETRQLWPIVVKIQYLHRWEQLETGAILVDLPGFGDVDLAREKVAKKAIENCDFLWVTTEINRVLTNAVAFRLVNKELRQAFLDDTVSDITIICTKSDVVNLKKAAMEHGLAKEYDHMKAKQEEIRQRKKHLGRDAILRAELMDSA